MELELFASGTPQVISELLAYKVDIAFVTGSPNHKGIIVLNKFSDGLYMVESKNKKSKNTIFGYRETSTHLKYFQKYYKNNISDEYKVTILENYEVLLGCIKVGMGKAFLSKIIIDKYGYTNDLKLTKLAQNECDLETHLVCKEDNIPMIKKYLTKIKL